LKLIQSLTQSGMGQMGQMGQMGGGGGMN
jgi:hypothetical protein